MTSTGTRVARPRPEPCCRDAERLHCHGTHLQHADDGECTEPGCALPAEAHEHRTRCVDAVPPCGCAQPPGAAVP